MARDSTPKIVIPRLPDDIYEELQQQLEEHKKGDSAFLVSKISVKTVEDLIAQFPEEFRGSVREQIRYDALPHQAARLSRSLEYLQRTDAYERETRQKMGRGFRGISQPPVMVSADLEGDFSMTSTEELPDVETDETDNRHPTKSPDSRGIATITTFGALETAILEYCMGNTCPLAEESERDALVEKMAQFLKTANPSGDPATRIGNAEVQFHMKKAEREAAKMAGDSKGNKNKQKRKERV